MDTLPSPLPQEDNTRWKHKALGYVLGYFSSVAPDSLDHFFSGHSYDTLERYIKACYVA